MRREGLTATCSKLSQDVQEVSYTLAFRRRTAPAPVNWRRCGSEGRHVGLDFYDLLIEEEVPPSTWPGMKAITALTL
jgi:hypothetical protein